MAEFSSVVLPDGARLAYEVFGPEHLGQRQPIVLIGGMSSLGGDWERLAKNLAYVRTVLVFDHRGMGNSTYSTPAKNDEITIESMARDLLFLVGFLRWNEIAICGFSMGGVIAQQLLFLPNHASNPTPLPFRVTHVMLTGTLSSVLRDKRFGLRINTSPPSQHRTLEEKRRLVRPTLESTFDPLWLGDPANSQRLEWWLDRMTSGRPTRTILQQGRALNRINFTGHHKQLPRDIQVMVIHGELDEVVPFYCAQEILQLMPWATMVGIGNQPGQVPNLRFGHHWFEYFDIQVWHNVVETFLARGVGQKMARL